VLRDERARSGPLGGIRTGFTPPPDRSAAIELALHNSLHNALTVHSGTDMWYYQPGVLESPSVINLGRALQEAAQKAFLGVSSWSIIGASNQLAEQ
jgi:hypothetical protein